MKRTVRWRLDKAIIRVRQKTNRPTPVIDQRQDEEGDEA